MNPKKKMIFRKILKVAQNMKAYKTDVTEIDKETLENYDGQFLWSFDEMSTHFVKIVFCPYIEVN